MSISSPTDIASAQELTRNKMKTTLLLACLMALAVATFGDDKNSKTNEVDVKKDVVEDLQGEEQRYGGYRGGYGGYGGGYRGYGGGYRGGYGGYGGGYRGYGGGYRGYGGYRGRRSVDEVEIDDLDDQFTEEQRFGYPSGFGGYGSGYGNGYGSGYNRGGYRRGYGYGHRGYGGYRGGYYGGYLG